jgi:tRNA (guanosine-2'-O-)-methyltransferase
MGLQDLHIVESNSKYSVNKKVLMGANKWMNLVRYNDKKAVNIEACYSKLKADGYRVLATDPSAGMSIDEVPLDTKVAVVMGNELKGITKYAEEHADGLIRIPMYGFTESMNISVSAALCIRSLVTRIRASSVSWQLTDDEMDQLRLDWYRKSVKNPGLMEKQFLSKGL